MSNFGWEVLSTNFPFLRRALCDLYTISPRLFIMTIIGHLWFAIEGSLSLYLSNLLFYSIEKKISGNFAGNRISSDLCLAVISSIACSMFDAYMNWLLEQTGRAYVSRIRYEYEARAFSAKLAWDLPTSQGIAVSNPNIDDVYSCLKRGLSISDRNYIIPFTPPSHRTHYWDWIQ
ncbi:hypothetical protein JVU11DRAFT_7162 [Chiua virens]|nr:hypothetical protein JVU11DRAFT_7162 [Chiua virens]